MLTRRDFLGLSAAGALSFAAVPAWARGAHTLGGPAFGSYWRLTMPDAALSAEATRAVVAVVDTVDALFSPYRSDSDISRFNLSPSTDIQPLSAACQPVVSAALDIAARSGGAFDPTVGPLVARYGFGPLTGAAPGHFSQLALTAEGLRKAEAGLSLDLCGIAKGHALDLAGQALDALGLETYLLDFGGELAARGAHPGGRPWQVAVENPLTGGLQHILALGGNAVATSGLAAQGYAINGQVTGHIIDPRRQAPVLGGTLSVSVLAATGIAADGWATALMALPSDDAVAMAGRNGLDALFLLMDGDAVKTVFTGRMADHLVS